MPSHCSRSPAPVAAPAVTCQRSTITSWSLTCMEVGRSYFKKYIFKKIELEGEKEKVAGISLFKILLLFYLYRIHSWEYPRHSILMYNLLKKPERMLHNFG